MNATFYTCLRNLNQKTSTWNGYVSCIVETSVKPKSILKQDMILAMSTMNHKESFKWNRNRKKNYTYNQNEKTEMSRRHNEKRGFREFETQKM